MTATTSAVLHRAAEILDDRDVVAAIERAAADEHLADQAMRALVAHLGFGRNDPRRYLDWWQKSRSHAEVLADLTAAADKAEEVLF